MPIGVASGRAYPLHESAEKVTDAMECYRYHIAAPMFADLCQKFARARVAIIAGPVSKRGDGSVGRCGDCATLCVFCVRRGLRRSGGVVRGRLRRPCRPLQVIGVLATVLPIARKSRQFSCSAERAGKVLIPAQINLAKSGERLHANTVRPMGRSKCDPVFKLSYQGTAIVRIRHVGTKSTIGGSRRIPCAIGA